MVFLLTQVTQFGPRNAGFSREIFKSTCKSRDYISLFPGLGYALASCWPKSSKPSKRIGNRPRQGFFRRSNEIQEPPIGVILAFLIERYRLRNMLRVLGSHQTPLVNWRKSWSISRTLVGITRHLLSTLFKNPGKSKPVFQNRSKILLKSLQLYDLAQGKSAWLYYNVIDIIPFCRRPCEP